MHRFRGFIVHATVELYNPNKFTINSLDYSEEFFQVNALSSMYRAIFHNTKDSFSVPSNVKKYSSNLCLDLTIHLDHPTYKYTRATLARTCTQSTTILKDCRAITTLISLRLAYVKLHV